MLLSLTPGHWTRLDHAWTRPTLAQESLDTVNTGPDTAAHHLGWAGLGYQISNASFVCPYDMIWCCDDDFTNGGKLGKSESQEFY